MCKEIRERKSTGDIYSGASGYERLPLRAIQVTSTKYSGNTRVICYVTGEGWVGESRLDFRNMLPALSVCCSLIAEVSLHPFALFSALILHKMPC